MPYVNRWPPSTGVGPVGPVDAAGPGGAVGPVGRLLGSFHPHATVQNASKAIVGFISTLHGAHPGVVTTHDNRSPERALLGAGTHGEYMTIM